MLNFKVTRLRLKKWPWPFNGSGGSGYWAGGSNFLVEVCKSSRFQGTSKDLGYLYRCGPQAPYCKGYPMTPHAVFGGFERFLGSGRVNWGQIAMFRVSKEW